MTQTKAQLVDLSVQGVNANNLSSGTVPDARFPAVLPAISGANLTSLPAANLTGTLPAISGSNLTSLPAANLTGTLPAISGANLTSLPAANLTGTLPAISGANLTNLPVDLSNLSATNLTSGTIPDARFPATLPAISGANLTNLPSSGISNVVEDTSPELGGNLDVLTSEIVTSTSNGNIKLAPNGSGAVEIKGDGSSYEGCLQLNCHVNSHGVKIKSPDHSAGQSYTMILPDNNITANKFLQVKSITGSGNTAVGQLEYADTFTGDVNFNGWATFNASILEKVVTATLGSAATLSPGTGGIQYLTLGQNCTITLSMATGQSFLVVITATSSGYSITWPTMRWAGGSAPTLGGATPTAIELWYDGNYYYGATVGDLS
tara:strand:- start:1343 stop:2473 length:1131 start_codon:yes stop_codon:yes gene_type:complete